MVIPCQFPALFIIGIGWPLSDGYPHEMRAADYDDWITETTNINGEKMHGLNGDILVWNPVTKRRHELSSMGVRVTKETLKMSYVGMSRPRYLLCMAVHKDRFDENFDIENGGLWEIVKTY